MGLSGEDMFGVMMAVNTYPVAVDSLSWDLFDQVFTTDVVADFGGGAMWSDLESLKRDFDTIHRPFKTTQHYTGNHVITGSGDEAYCFSYVARASPATCRKGRTPTRPMAGMTTSSSAPPMAGGSAIARPARTGAAAIRKCSRLCRAYRGRRSLPR